ncbi:MAG TPA: TonB-dependent receptor [Bryobacteraceae bacterium]|nr:TonB-dependent receptor [Bryobacteraceae bacterium]
MAIPHLIHTYFIVLYVVLIILIVSPAWPQASTSTVRGTVLDQAGAAIANGSVFLTNTSTNITIKTSTNEVGFYMFPGVVPGPYELSIEAPGMQRFVVALTVQVQQAAVVDAVMQVGTTTTKVEVMDVTPMLVVDNPTLGHVLERTRIEQLPINSRNVFNLLQTVPGLEQTWRAYGLRSGSQEIVLDGAYQSDRLWGGGQRRPPGLDTIQEFKVETNNSSAKFTRPTTIVMLTRSGTNDIHGSLFETHRSNFKLGPFAGKARARTDYFDRAPKLVRNEFGGTVGGPVVLPKLYNGRDRTFWFFSYEGQRMTNPATRSGSVPTEAMKNGDFSGLVDSQGRQFKLYDPWTTDPATWQRQQFAYGGRPNVIDPARQSPLGKYLFSITPAPTIPNVNPLVEPNWFGPVPNTQRQWTITGRFDHNFTENDRFYARWTQGDHDTLRYPFGTIPMIDWVPGSVTNQSPNKSLALSWMRTFSPTLFNELLVSGSREHWTDSTGEAGVKYADRLGLPNPFGVAGWPGIYDWSLRNYYFETGNPQATAFTYYVIGDNATKVVGKHELQFGFHFRYDQLNYLPDQQHPQGNHDTDTRGTALFDPASSPTNPLPAPFTGHTLGNLYLGVMNYSNQFVRGYFYARGKEYSLYFQDNYKVTPRLTLNLGLRWEYWPAFTEKNNVITTFDPQRKAIVLGQDLPGMYRIGATLPSIVDRLQFLGMNFTDYKEAGYPKNLRKNYWKDFGPRLGFAYRTGDSQNAFVLRGGYRVSYFPTPMYTWGQRMRQNPPLTARFTNYLTDAAQAPDGIGNYGMRSVPAVIAGQNSREAVKLSDPRGLTRGGALVSYFANEQPDSRVQDWNFTIEKEVMEDTAAKVSYVGNHSDRLEQFYRYNESTPEYLWYVTTGERLPTGEYSGVLRRPFDKVVYGTIEEFRKTGWSNFQGIQLELERRYSKGYGYQIFYVMSNALRAGGEGYGGTSYLPDTNMFLPGRVPTDMDERNRFLNYSRDTGIPKHRVRWNWIVDLPFGKGKPLGGNAGPVLHRFIGNWQVAGIGSLWSTYFSLPTGVYPNGNAIEIYGYKYPIQDCRSGVCYPGYLWWNGYIPANQINSVDPATGKPNGVMGVPSNYKPAGEPLLPWPASPNESDPLYNYYGTNTVWVPLNDGSVQRVGFGDNLHPWRLQYFPSTRQWSLDASLFKTIPIRERFYLRFTADFFNVLNHPGNPSSVESDGILSTRYSGISARELQFSLRLNW